MFARRSIEVTTSYGITVDHLLIAHDDPAGLLIMLPGRGYTCDHPVLHYLRKAAFDLGYDVLSIRYGFQVAAVPDDQITIEGLAAEIDPVFSEVLKSSYKRVCIAGKSLGTPLAALHTSQAERLILLTPIGTSVQDAGTTPTLAIIGTADPVYQPEQTQISGVHVQWLVLEGLNHSLEASGDWLGSLDALRQIIGACVEFLA